MSRTGGTWSAHRRLLDVHQLAARQAGRWSVTESGLGYLGHPASTGTTPAELLTLWKRALGTGPARLLDALLAHPKGLTRHQLATLVTMSATGGTFNAHLRALIVHELATMTSRTGHVVIANTLRVP